MALLWEALSVFPKPAAQYLKEHPTQPGFARIPGGGIPKELQGIYDANPQLFNKAWKARNLDEFLKGMGTPEKVDYSILTDFYNKVKGLPQTGGVGGVRKYQIAEPTGMRTVEGGPVKIVNGVDTFLRAGDNGHGFAVSEASTGRLISVGESKDEAIAQAKSTIATRGKDNLIKMIEKYKVGGLKAGEVTPNQKVSQIAKEAEKLSEEVRQQLKASAPKGGKVAPPGVQLETPSDKLPPKQPPTDQSQIPSESTLAESKYAFNINKEYLRLRERSKNWPRNRDRLGLKSYATGRAGGSGSVIIESFLSVAHRR